MNHLRLLLPLVLLGLFACSPATSPQSDAAAPGALPAIAAKTKGMERQDGFLPFHVDAKEGKIWLELPGTSGLLAEALYVEGLLTGLGSNPVGLDRGQLGDAIVLRFRRVGPRVVAEIPNLRYRARSESEDERRAVEQSFATSILWSGKIVAQDDAAVLVDFTDFLVRDAHDVVPRLKATGQGSFSLDKGRSLVDPENCLAFPDNVEFEAILTFKGSSPGPLVRETAPDGSAITLIQHHSLIRLPDDGYTPRRFDPRMGMFDQRFADYAVPIEDELTQRWIVRHRLEKTDPTAAVSAVKEPLVYYVDRGAPEPIRQALIDGARWWADAFEAAGFRDAYRVEVLPEGAHPLDVRYNVIQWVHRSTRGWSYGGGVIDPRTGEMIKGHVSLGSLRVRQDRMLMEGLFGADATGSGGPNDPLEISLARIRQLSAHEVGHTLGITHNFAASAYGRESVMDYPAPWIQLTDDGFDASAAYDVGIGDWDIQTVKFGYAQFPPGADEDAELEKIVAEGLEKGLLFVSDHDARSLGTMHPLGNLWDNGADPVDALDHTMRVRRRGLERFGLHNIPVGAPTSDLHDVFVPLYLHHRFQIHGAGKLIGGQEFQYSRRGDGRPPAQPVPGDRQRAALQSLLATLDPVALDIPDATLALLAPRAYGYVADQRELFPSRGYPAFDTASAAAIAADLTLDVVLDSNRCARVVDQHRRDNSLPGLGEVLDALVAAGRPRSEPARLAGLRAVVLRTLADRMVDLAARNHTAPAVRAVVEDRLARLADDLGGTPDARLLARDLKRFLEDRTWDGPQGARPHDAPPGSPIGSDRGCGFAW